MLPQRLTQRAFCPLRVPQALPYTLRCHCPSHSVLQRLFHISVTVLQLFPCPPSQHPHSSCTQEEHPAGPAGQAHASVPVELVLCSRKEMLRPRHNMPRRGPLWHGVPSLPPRCPLALALALLCNPSPAFLFSFYILCSLVPRKLKSRMSFPITLNVHHPEH